jgi:hypothetical protein
MGWLFSGLALAAFAATGCGATTDEDGPEIEDSADLDAKADGLSNIAGTWRGPSWMTLLALKTDKTYHKEMKIYCITAPCDPIEENGTFKLTKSGSNKYITLKNALHGAGTLKYRYTLSGDTLKLQRAGTTTWEALTRDGTGWCAVASDCDKQNLVLVMCVGQWSCATDRCSYQCGLAPAGREGDICGTRTINGMAECADGLYCDFSLAAACGAADRGGTCAKKPVGPCALAGNRVCGCDGQNYLGSCEPAKKGVSIRSLGPCEN